LIFCFLAGNRRTKVAHPKHWLNNIDLFGMPRARNFLLAQLGEGQRQELQGPKHRIPPGSKPSPQSNPSALFLDAPVFWPQSSGYRRNRKITIIEVSTSTAWPLG
jgi:hypothetical protein